MAQLKDEDRKKLEDADFAEPEHRKYPIEDESHARNALSDEQRARLKRFLRR